MKIWTPRPAFAWTVAILLALVSTLPSRFMMNPDGITYMNLATLYQQGEWAQAINAYWSPVYPLLIAATFKIVHPSAQLESTTVHALTFVIYLGTFAAFRFFLRELRASQHAKESGSDETFALSFNRLADSACAYALFFWAALTLIGFPLVTPDMAIALLLFVAAALTLKLRRGTSVIGYPGLGAILGLAYLTKAVMFPLGIVMCVCCGLPAAMGNAAKRTLLALAGFFIIASPQLVAMSHAAGHFSYGESGTVAYANEVNRTPKFWVGQPAGSGTPEHPMRLLSKDPSAYDVSLPNTTFSNPVSDQLAGWMQGVRPHVSLAQQLGVTKKIVSWYAEVFEVLIFAGLALFLLRRLLTLRFISLIIPAIAALGIYALVYAESRYLGAWVVILFLCLAASFEFDEKAKRGAVAVMGALALFYGFSTLNLTRSEVMNAFSLSRQQYPNPQFETAVELRNLGVVPGSRVAGIGYMFNAYWARLAGVQIAMQIPEAGEYSSASESVRTGIIESFRRAGAVAVVSVGKPSASPGENWQPLVPIGYWVLVLVPLKLNN